MGVLCVTSLREGAGKTAFCTGLAHLLRQQGHYPTLFKPVRITGSTAPDEPDADAAFFAHLQDAPPPDGWPVDVKVQEAGEGLRARARERILAAFQKAAGRANEIIVEGPSMAAAQAGTLAITPELAEALDARVVLLVRYSPMLHANDILGPARSLGHRLLGVVVNGVLRYRTYAAQTSLVASLREQGMSVLGVLPESRLVGMGVTVGQLAQHVGGEFLLGEEKRDQLVAHLMIGGLVLDGGVHYFGQSDAKAVIVRGDRPDIQMAALNTPTRCLVLTGGHHPIQHVQYEAEEEEVPIALVQSDTLTTAKALETLFERVTIHHPAKVECFAQLLGRAIDLQVVVTALSRV